MWICGNSTGMHILTSSFKVGVLDLPYLFRQVPVCRVSVTRVLQNEFAEENALNGFRLHNIEYSKFKRTATKRTKVGNMRR
jgi:hypothetical protein